MLGDALAAMVDAVDQRIVLEAALIRVAGLDVDNSSGALLERIERLERAAASGLTPAAGPPPSAAPAAPAPAKSEGPAAAARRAITPAGDLPSRDDLTLAWGDELLNKIPRGAKARYTTGRFVEVGDRGAVFAVPNAAHAAKCEEFRIDVERVLAEHFGRPVPLVLTVDATAPVPEPRTPEPKAVTPRTVTPKVIEEPDEVIDVHELEDAPPDNRTSLDQLADAFPGAELLPEDNGV